jgi:ABC-type multidrug transport system ATPase subunit
MTDRITKIEVRGLWGREDLVWNLLPDVNILSGRNGSGKTTLIQSLTQLVRTGGLAPDMQNLMQGMTVTFSNGDRLVSGEGRAAEGHRIDIIGPLDGRDGAYPPMPRDRTLFFDRIDELFSPSGKTIDRQSDALLFDTQWGKVTPQRLSSGEKQLLLIFATVLTEERRPAILLMDEPEISLHFDWQSRLIRDIRLLNPRVQLILSTHSPAMVLEGWLGHVTEIDDLITNGKG